MGRVTLPEGNTLVWTMTTDYPWDGVIELTLNEAPNTPVSLHVRIPDWAADSTLTVNGMVACETVTPGTYCCIERVWESGDTLRLNLPMSVRHLVGHPNVVDITGCAALMRGPLVYCVEQTDHPDIPLETLTLPAGAILQPVWHPELLGGVITLEGIGRKRDLFGWLGTLYQTLPAVPKSSYAPVQLVAIPYYAWANRTPGPMYVWIPTA